MSNRKILSGSFTRNKVPSANNGSHSRLLKLKAMHA